MAVKKLRFMWLNYSDSAIVTASSEAADYPVANLQNRWKTVDWRSTGLTAEWVKENLGSAKAVQAFVLENMNLTAGATVALQAHASDLWTAPSYSLAITITAAMVAAKRIVIFLAAAETYQWWRLLVTDAANGDGHLSASRIYLGPYFEPTRSYKTQWERSPASDSVVSYSSGGQASVTERPIFWVYNLPISIVGSADELAYAAIDDTCGIKIPLWICLDSTDEIVRTVYGHFMEYIAFPSVIDGSLWDTNLKFREEL